MEIKLLLKSTFIVFILFLSGTAGLAQTNTSVATAKLIDSFPHTEYDINTSDGGSNSPVGCAITCCSTYVYKVVLTTYGSLRVQNSNYKLASGTIMAYTTNVANPTSADDLAYYDVAGNYCGFKDSLQLGNNYDWGSAKWAADSDLNDPDHVAPPGEYYILLFTDNQSAGNTGNTSDFTFQFESYCQDGTSILFVNSNASGGNNGSSWTDAYTSLNTALDAATGCDEVWIAKGTYTPTEKYDGTTDSQRDFSFSVPAGAKLYGGFVGTETDTSQRTDYGSGGVNETIFNGDLSNNDAVVDGKSHYIWENAYYIVTDASGNDISGSSSLNDITIKGSNSANRYLVKHDASGSNNGSSWVNAYTSLQTALENVSISDEIWVAKGTYTPSSAYDLTDTQRYYHFRMIDGVAIYGGFAGTESAITERTNYGKGGANETYLSGDFNDDDNASGSGATLTISGNSENSYHIFHHPSGYTLSNSALLDGFTLKGGAATAGSNPDDDGAAINNRGGQSPNINNCYFIYNAAADKGGAIYNSTESNANITNCTFSQNYAVTFGGAIGNYGSHPTIINSVFYGNKAETDRGGAVYNFSASSPTLTNCTFIENSAVSGGGVANIDDSNVTICNSIFWGNLASGSIGPQIRNSTQCRLAISFSNIEGGVIAGVYSSGTGASVVEGSGNINSDPKFAASGDHPYNLTASSPCLDAAASGVNAEKYDIRGFGYARGVDGTNRTNGIMDIGAYEYQYGNDPLPVELVSFIASIEEGAVELTWETATEVDNYGFEVERRNQELRTKNQESEFETIGFVPGYGNSNSPKQYEFVDTDIPSDSLEYRLKQIDTDGTFIYYAQTAKVGCILTGSDNETLPTEYSLEQNYPNPFNPTTVIEYSIPSNVKGEVSNTTLVVYDMLGREVAVLVNKQQQAGRYSIEFNASHLASGMYIYRLTSADFVSNKKLLLMK